MGQKKRRGPGTPVLINPSLIDIFMFDEKIRFYKCLPKTIKLHSISTESEFMLYLNIKKSKNLGQNPKKINFVVNSGLLGKKLKGNKIIPKSYKLKDDTV